MIFIPHCPKLKNKLFKRDFIRIHKSFLVSKNHIIKVFHNSVILKNNIQLPIGRKYKKKVDEFLNQNVL